MPERVHEAAVLDLDGVITRTADVHARAWKQVFDEVLASLAGTAGSGADADAYRPFDIIDDYRKHVDGLPRHDGIRRFFESRGIELPEGSPDDPESAATVHGIGKRKNRRFREVLASGGVEVYDDTVEELRRWRDAGAALAVVSSSRNCEAVLHAAQLSDLFDARVDGVISAELGISGKPAPDIFLEAARRLGVEPARAVAFEDAVAGVRAARDAGFGLVVGVDRGDMEDELMKNGAHVVTSDLGTLGLSIGAPRPRRRDPDEIPSLRSARKALSERLERETPVIFLDYDGTLTPIVSRPEKAVLAPDMRRSLERLAARCTVVVVSGRDRANVEQLVGVDGLAFAGSHGFDIAGPGGLRRQHEAGEAALPALDASEKMLGDALKGVPGSQVERKRYAIAVHYRNVAEDDVPAVERAVSETLAAHSSLRRTGGKKVFELRPDVDWDKGRAVRWLLEELQLDRPEVLPIYIGDDVTDEDAFTALAGRGLGILVGEGYGPTTASYRLPDVDAVRELLDEITEQLDRTGKGDARVRVPRR